MSSPIHHHNLSPKMPLALTCLLCQMPLFAPNELLSIFLPALCPPAPVEMYQWAPGPLTSRWVWHWQEINRKEQRELGEFGVFILQVPSLWSPQGLAASRGLSSSKAALSSVVFPLPVTYSLNCLQRLRGGNGAPILLIWGSTLCLVFSIYSAHTFVNIGCHLFPANTPRKFDLIWVECPGISVCLPPESLLCTVT